MALSPKIRFLKRSLIGFASISILLTLVRLLWGWHANRELQAEIKVIHARGEPILISDYQQPRVADGENAAIYLQQAMASIANNHKLLDLNVLAWLSQPFSSEEIDLIPIFLNDNSKAVKLLHQALKYSHGAWNLPYDSDYPWGLRGPALEMSQLYELINLLNLTWYAEHQSGDDAAMLDTLEELFRFAQVTATYPAAWNWIPPTNAAGSAAEGAILVGMRISLQDDLNTTHATGSVTRRQVENLIAQFLDERAARDGAVRFCMGQRMDALQFIRIWPRTTSRN